MANVHLQFSSFNAGELSPFLGNRFAVEKVQSGCRRLRNFYCHIHGPALRRPGMQYMGPAASNAEKSRLAPFNFSTTTGFVLEFAPSGLRVWSNGVSVPLKSGVALPYSEDDCGELQMVQVNDVCYLAHPNHEPRKLVRYADDDWRLEDIAWTWPAMGDENVRPAEIAAPDVTDEVTTPTQKWPEAELPAGAYVFETVGTVTSPAGAKSAVLQRWNAGDWVTMKTLSWNGSAPTDINVTLASVTRVRITYTGPTLDTPGDAVKIGAGLDVLQLALDDDQPRDTTQEVTITGEWQVAIDCTAATVFPSNAPQVWVQQDVDGTWTTIKTLTARDGESLVWRGPAYKHAQDIRLNYRGTRAIVGGEMRISTLDYPPPSGITLACSDTTGNDRTLTASEPIFTAGHVGSYWQLGHMRADSYVQIVAAVTTISAESSAAIRVTGRWDLFTYGTWDTTLFLEKRINGAWEVYRSWVSEKDRNVIASGTEEEECELRLRVLAGTSEAATGAAVPRFILELTEARVYGLVKITAVGALTDGKTNTATVDVLYAVYSTAATTIWTEGAWSEARGYPRAVSLYGQRLWFAGTTKEPQRLWGSVVADYENFRRSSLDDASVSFTPAAQQVNAIQWLADHAGELVIGTSGDEWTLGPATGGLGIVTPVSAVLTRRSAYGSAYVPPLMLGEGLVFLQRGAQKLRQIGQHTETVTWSAANLTVLAEHLTRPGIVQLAAMTFPITILWAVTEEGKLLGMTFESEQNVFGWHQHETSGTVESVAVVHGAETDEVWLSVVRNGKRLIERLDPKVFAQDFSDRERLIYLDSATLAESGEPVSSVAGLDHLNGRTVTIMGDGAELESRTVSGGGVTLSNPASVVVVGLPFTSELQPMAPEVQMRDGTSVGRGFKTPRVTLALHSSLGGEVADSPSARYSALNYRRVSTPLGAPPELFTGDVETVMEASTRKSVDVTVRQTGPFPLNVGAIVAELDVFGGGAK